MGLKKLLIKIRAPLVRINLKNSNFTIISNNCWGGVVYRDRGIPYNSPTVGLFIFSNDYIKFLSNIKYYLSLDMKQISIYDSNYYECLIKNCDENLVIGVLDDVELVMFHYKTFDEAKSKWDRRKKRINYDNMLVKFSDQNLFKEEDYFKFKSMNFANKLFITVNNKYDSEITCVVKDEWGLGFAKDDIKPSFKVLNVNKLLNEMERNE